MTLDEARLLLHLCTNGGRVRWSSRLVREALGARASSASARRVLDSLCSAGLVSRTAETVAWTAAPRHGLPPLDAERARIVERCRGRARAPAAAVGRRIDAARRGLLLAELAREGHLKPSREILTVTVTPAGRGALAWDWEPPARGLLPMRLVGEALRTVRNARDGVPRTEASPDLAVEIARIDRESGCGGHVPIHLLRERLNGRLSREETDRQLFALEEAGRLRMTTLQDGHAYTRQQYEAGIPSRIGGPRFFLALVGGATGSEPVGARPESVERARP